MVRTTRNPWFSNFCVITIPLSRNSKEYFINGDIYSICRSCWNVATYKWKVHNGKIEIISIVVKSPLLKICVTNDHKYVPLAIVTVPYSFSSLIMFTRFVTEVTRRVPLVGSKMVI
jgi:hypothetical protein